MPDLIQSGAPADGSKPVEPNADTLDLSKFFGAVTIDEAPVIAPPSDPQPEQKPDPAQAPTTEKAPEQKAEVESEIAAALREMREERAARDQVKQEAQTWKGRYEALQEEFEAFKSAPRFEDDPLEYIHLRKLSPEQVTEIVQLLAYDLNPAAAPQDFRFKIFESKQARKEREQREAQQRAQAEQAQAQQQQVFQQFVRGLDSAVQTFSAESYPANEAWYGEDRTSYVHDLFNLANELAEQARAQGGVADVSAEALAAKLEQKNAAKLAAIEARRSKRAPKAEPAPVAAGGVQSTGVPASTQGMGLGGPRPPAMTEEDRVKRAIAAAFPAR